MKYFEVGYNTTLAQVRDKFGVDTSQILASNGLDTDPDFAGQLRARYAELTADYSQTEIERINATGQLPVGRYPATADGVTNATALEQFQRQRQNDAEMALKKASASTDVFASVVSLSLQELQVYERENLFPDKVAVPDSVGLSSGVIGNGTPVPQSSVDSVISAVQNGVSPFGNTSLSAITHTPTTPMQIGLVAENSGDWHISLREEVVIAIDGATPPYLMIPCYPDGGISDEFKANFEEMPEARHQYEPWQIYKSSGGRIVTLTFKLARVLWSGNYYDGKCEELIRYAQSAAYCNYYGALVEVPLVTIICGEYFRIRGYVQNVSVQWYGEFGEDLKPLLVDLKITIQEVSDTPLNANDVRARLGSYR